MNHWHSILLFENDMVKKANLLIGCKRIAGSVLQLKQGGDESFRNKCVSLSG